MAYLNIPKFASPGQPNAFANRKHELAQLYGGLVSAGNALARGDVRVSQRWLVHGVIGAGKSSVILRALECLRDGPPKDSGLPEAADPQRWIVMYFSGKRIGAIEEFVDAVLRLPQQLDAAVEAPAPNPLLSFFSDVIGQANADLPKATEIPLVSRLFKTADARAYKAVSASLRVACGALDELRKNGGAKRTRREESRDERKAEGQLSADLTGGATANETRLVPGLEAEAKAALSAKWKREFSHATSSSDTLERSWRIGAEQVVLALNAFFEATRAARLPTVLVLDDLDEFASSEGANHHARAKVLKSLLGTLNQLSPTFLVIGLREEYLMEDVQRQFTPIHVPLLIAQDGALAVNAWLDLHDSGLTPEDRANALRIGQALLGHYAAEDRVLLLYRYLQAVARLFNSGFDPGAPRDQLLRRVMELELSGELVDAIDRVAAQLDAKQAMAASRAVPIDLGELKLTQRDRDELTKYGLYRPHVAGDPDDTTVVLDPLIGWWARART